MSNTHINKARKRKNDEFFTRREDIQKELPHYKEQFKGKRVFCNCDGPESEFVKFFTSDNYKNLHKYDLSRFYSRNLDFRGEDSLKILIEHTDIVLTNPPFSLFREFLEQLVEYDKKFLLVAPVISLSYPRVVTLLRENKVWLGKNRYLRGFRIPTGEEVKKPCLWLTNLHQSWDKKFLTLTKEYNPTDYPKYDNYDAIYVDKTKNIPKDYNGVMGVPVTYLLDYNPEQFEILGMDKKLDGQALWFWKGGKINAVLNGKVQFTKVFIMRK